MAVSEHFRIGGVVGLAYDIAERAHQGVEYAPGRRYIEHPIEVANLAMIMGYPDEVVAGCLGHDIIEDTSETRDSLLEAGLPLIVVEGIEAVTYTGRDEIARVDKIDKAKAHVVGHVIKFCDSSRNFATSVNNPQDLPVERVFHYTRKYSRYLGRLIEGLPSPQKVREFVASA